MMTSVNRRLGNGPKAEHFESVKLRIYECSSLAPFSRGERVFNDPIRIILAEIARRSVKDVALKKSSPTDNEDIRDEKSAF